ncbi:ATP-dependent DNA helicase 2 subunit KU80 [Linum perenne]
MARNKENMVLVLDVGPAMHALLPEVEKVCAMLIEKKLIYHRADEVGIVLFGTQGTDNELAKEVGGYEHIMVLQNMKVVDGDLVRGVHQLPRGAVHGDYLDAIVVGVDLLVKKYQDANKGKKRICLITNAQCPVKDPIEGTKEDQVSMIGEKMDSMGVAFETIVVRGVHTDGANKGAMDENDHLLNLFSTKTSAKIVYVHNPTSLLGALRTRNITPVTIFRGDFEIGSTMKIKVWVYKKSSEEKFPTLKKYSNKAPPTDKFATHDVKVDYQYWSVEDPVKVIPPEQRIKGYRYGPQVVPISAAEWDAVKFKTEKGVKFLGFADSTNVMRHYYMKDVNIFIAEPGNTRATLAVSALARAMRETSNVAIVRCVWREGQQNVVLGVLTPNISEKDDTPDSFYFNTLPFIEDVREFQFPSFSNFPASWHPNDKQQEAADELVKMLDLAPSGREEFLLPDLTPNPILERFYSHLEIKSKEPDAAVPPLDGTLKRIIEPDPELVSENKHVIDRFRSSFEKKSTKHLMMDKAAGSDEDEGYLDAPSTFSLNAKGDVVHVNEIGDSTPVQDFEAMMSRRDFDAIEKAIQKMRKKIMGLLNGGEYNNGKALDCLEALRKGCIREQEPKQYNELLRECLELWKDEKVGGLYREVASRGLTLISKSEAPDSDVREDEASGFLIKEPKEEE